MKAEQSKSQKARNIILIIILVAIPILLAGLIFLGTIIVAPFTVWQVERVRNNKAAEKVVLMIEDIEDENITVDFEDELNTIKAEYDKLTDKQKKLVQNYGDLEAAFDKLATEKIEALPREIVAEIGKIKADELTAESTVVSELLNKYNGLSKEQKELVTNIDLLNEYKKIVDEKIEIQKKGKDLVENFKGFKGKWGDFGVHINEHQGMIEAIIKSDREKFLFQDYFSGSPNNLDMYVSTFETDDKDAMGSCFVRFSGPSRNHSGTAVVYGEVIVNNDGTLKFVLDSSY